MSITDHLRQQWVGSRYFTRTVFVIATIPIAVWGASTVEATLLCALRALSSLVSFDAKTRSKRWESTTLHFWDVLASGALCGVSLVPLYGTYQSYKAIFGMILNHVSNQRMLRELEQKQNSKKVEGLYQELLVSEPDVDQLIRFATNTPLPTQDEIDRVSQSLRGSLVGRSWIYSCLFHLMKEGSTALKICTIRVARAVSTVLKTLFLGRFLRIFQQTARVMAEAVVQEARYSRDLVSQPLRMSVPKNPVRELNRDEIFLMLETCPSEEERTIFRQTLARVSLSSRQHAIENDLARISSDPPLPEGAPIDYFHKRGMLPKACGCRKAISADYILNENYFKPIFPYLEAFDMDWLKVMPAQEKQKLMWGLSTKLPALQALQLNMQGIDPLWQLLIVIQFAKHAPDLRCVTLTHADHRAINLMRRFCSWRCTVVQN